MGIKSRDFQRAAQLRENSTAVHNITFQPLGFGTRLPALDGIRALAVTAVFALHYGGGAHGGRALQAYNTLRLRGWVGVDLFFVLSGFLITGILYDTRNDSAFFSRFYARRSLRIFPIFYTLALFLAVLTPIVHYEWQREQFWFLAYLGNIPVALGEHLFEVPSQTFPFAAAHLGHLWTLCVEEQFYLLWPLLVWQIRDRIQLIRIAAGLSFVALLIRCVAVIFFSPGSAWTFTYYMLPCRMDALLIGALLALLLRGPAADAWQRRCTPFFCVGMALVVAIFVLSPAQQSPWLMTVGYTLIAGASVGLVGMSLRSGTMIYRILTLRPLKILGKYSYGFYLYHLLWPKAWVYVATAFAIRLHSSILAGVLSNILNFVVTFVIAKLSYDLYESRFLRLKSKFEYDQIAGSVHQSALI